MTTRPTRRERYERARRRRSNVIATVSTVVVVGALIILIPMSPGWDRVRQAFFDGDVFRRELSRVARERSGSTSRSCCGRRP